jgi:hypothetical protein
MFDICVETDVLVCARLAHHARSTASCASNTSSGERRAICCRVRMSCRLMKTTFALRFSRHRPSSGTGCRTSRWVCLGFVPRPDKLAAHLDSSFAWQDVTIRLIAQRGVFHGKAPPSTSRKWTLRGFVESRRSRVMRQGALGAPVDASSEYLEQETAYTEVSLPPPLSGREHHLFCSEFNTGALALAKQLGESNFIVSKDKQSSAALSFTMDVNKLAECDHSNEAVCDQLSAATLASSYPPCLLRGQCSFCSTRARGRAAPTRLSSSSTSTRPCESVCTSAACTKCRRSWALLVTRATLR